MHRLVSRLIPHCYLWEIRKCWTLSLRPFSSPPTLLHSPSLCSPPILLHWSPGVQPPHQLHGVRAYTAFVASSGLGLSTALWEVVTCPSNATKDQAQCIYKGFQWNGGGGEQHRGGSVELWGRVAICAGFEAAQGHFGT